MKKFISFLVVGVALCVLPLKASAIGISGVCDPSQKVCKDDKTQCTATCTVSITGNTETLTDFSGTLEVTSTGATITSLTPGDGWESTGTFTGGTSVPFSFISTTGVTASNFTLLTITMDLESSATSCSFTLKNPSKGTEITIDVPTTTTVTKTGAALPIALVVCGVVACAVIYMQLKKNKKVYKI